MSTIALATCGPPKIQQRRRFDQTLIWDGALPADLVERIWTAPTELLNSGARLQDKLRCTVARIDYSGASFTWKYHNWGTVARTLKKSIAQSPARKSWQGSSYLTSAGIPTPRVRAVLEKTFGPFQQSSFLLTDYVVGTSLYRLLRFESPSPELLSHLASQVSTIWQQLDDLGVWHNDFKTENFLVDNDSKVWLIDLERMRRFGNADRSRLRERQVKDICDLLHPRNWRSNPAAAEIFRRAIAGTAAGRQALAGPQASQHPLCQPIPGQTRQQQLVSVLIPCRNAADSIVGCLESVRDMADEILVVDLGSTDGTLDRVRAFGGCRILEQAAASIDMHSPEAILSTMQRAIAQAKYDWILRLYPEEQLNGELSRQIQDLLATEPERDGLLIGRTVYFHGQRLRRGAFRSKPMIRLFRRRVAQLKLHNGRVEIAIPGGRIGTMKSRLSYEACASVRHCVEEILQHATLAANFSSGRAEPAPLCRSLLWRVPMSFLKSYFWRWGWLDGRAGLQASFIASLSTYLHEAIRDEISQPPLTHRTLVHDRRTQLRVFAPEEGPPRTILPHDLPRRSAA